MTRLIFYINIGDEDGPSFTYLLDQISNTSCPIHIICYDSSEFWFDKTTHPGDGNLLSIIKEYHVTEVLEIHDWYDYLNQREIGELQSELCAEYDRFILTASNDQEYILVTIIEYNELPRKYLIPKVKYQSIPNVIEFMKMMSSYQVETSYHRLLTFYYISSHYYYLFDVIDKDDIRDIALAVADAQLVEI